MAIYRGIGGSGDATGDAANASAIALAAANEAEDSATAAAASASSATASAAAAASSAATIAGALLSTNNLSDLSNTTTARSNLGLGSLATQSGTFSGTSSGTNTGDQTNISGNATTATTATNLSGGSVVATTISGTDLTTTGNTILGNASTDTLNVGNGGLVKDASGNLGIGTASPAVKLDINATDAIKVPVGTTAQRPTGATGYIRFNSTLNVFESYNGTAWGSIGGGATGAGGDAIFQENSMIVTTNYTLTTGKSASSVGPITVNSGVTVTVPSGSRWVVL